MAAPLPDGRHVQLVKAWSVQEDPELHMRIPSDAERNERGPRKDGRDSPCELSVILNRHAFSPDAKEPEDQFRG